MAPSPDQAHDIERAIAAWITGRLPSLGHGAADEVRVTLHGAPASGNSNLTAPLTVAWNRGGEPQERTLVLRMQTGTNRIFLDPDVLREAAVLRGLESSPRVPAPRVVLEEPDPAVLGHPFFLMDHVAGTVPHGMPSVHTGGLLPTLTASERRTLWESAMSAHAAIHAVDWPTHHAFLTDAFLVDASGADSTTGRSLDRRIEQLTRWYEWVCDGRSFPITDTALGHLRSNRPVHPGPEVLCWGDPRIGNMIFRDDGTCAAVLDWELASIGPAALDLGWWLVMEEFQTSAHRVTPLAGWPGRDETIDWYEDLTGTTVEELAWYEILAAWVLTVTVIRMADISVARGALPPSTRMGHGNLTAQMLARRLDLPVPALDPDYARRRGLPTV